MTASDLINHLVISQKTYFSSLDFSAKHALSLYVQQKFDVPSLFDPNVKWPGIFLIEHTGGASGGNCWGDDPEDYETGRTCDDQLVIERLIQAKISVSKAEETLLKALLVREFGHEDSCGEWYGNHSRYDIVYVTFEALTSALIMQGKLEY